jgi:hypothetical protein
MPMSDTSPPPTRSATGTGRPRLCRKPMLDSCNLRLLDVGEWAALLDAHDMTPRYPTPVELAHILQCTSWDSNVGDEGTAAS